MKHLYEQLAKYAKKIIPYVDYAVLFAYALMLFCEFSRYIESRDVDFWNVFYNSYVQKYLLLIVVIKLGLYLFENPRYSVLSAVGIAASFVFNRYLDPKPWFFLTVLLVISVYKIKFEKVIYTFLIAVGIPFVIKSVGAIIGVFPNEVEVVHDRRPRYDLGFTHHNTAFNYFFFIFLAVVYTLRKKKVKFAALGVMALILIGVVYVTDSLSGTIMLVGCLLLLAVDSVINTSKYSKMKELYGKLLGVVGICAVPFALLVSVGGTLGWNYYCLKYGKPEIWNTAFSRFYCMSYNAGVNGLRLPMQPDYIIPSETKFNLFIGGTAQTWEDNAYGALFVDYGIIVFLLYVVFFIAWIVVARNRKNNAMLIIAITIAFMSVMEAASILYGWNPFLLLPLAISEVSKDYVENS